MTKEWLRNNWVLSLFITLIGVIIIAYVWNSVFGKSIYEMNSYNPNLIPEEKYYSLKKFNGGSTEESGPFLSTSFSINSNKIKLVGIKKQFTEFLAICIDSSDYNAPIPRNNCVRLKDDYYSELESTEFPLKIDKKYRYEISVVSDGDWKAEVFEYRK